MLSAIAWRARGGSAPSSSAPSIRRSSPPTAAASSRCAACFARTLRRGGRTLERALTGPRLLARIGNAYSDEMLHAAPHTTLRAWTGRLIAAAAGGWPEEVTAVRPGMAVPGRYGQPCPACGTAVQRIRHATSETNDGPRCQTGGRVLADRALVRLLRSGWPRTIEELEQQGVAAGR